MQVSTQTTANTHKARLHAAMTLDTWRELLVGFNIPADTLTGREGPCPVCGGNTRFTFDNKYGAGDGYCRTCARSYDAYALIEAVSRKPFLAVIQEMERLTGIVFEPSGTRTKPKAKKLEYWEQLWREAKQITGDCLASQYLHNRGLKLARLPCDVRFHAAVPFNFDGQKKVITPAMLALIKDRSQQPIGLQRYFLTNEGTTYCDDGKLALGKLNHGGSVQLAGRQGGVLGVAEGLETALACEQLYALPVWATLSATNLAKFLVPDGITELVIFGDPDVSFTGQAAAFTLAKRYAGRMKVKVEWPTARPSNPITSKDFLDLLNEVSVGSKAGCKPYTI